MGVIGGLWLVGENEGDLRARLEALLGAQRHRDASPEAEVHSEADCACGMKDVHNAIWTNAPARGIECNGAYAFVDGIVLEGRKLAAELKAQGIVLKGPTCAELVAGAYAAWGLDFMGHLEGEFGCAVWDSRERRLILASDPFAHKPIHYYRDAKGVIFSSEIKGLLAAGVPAEVDPVRLSDYLSLNAVPTPHTIFKGIRRVPMGTMLVCTERDTSERQYWSHVPVPNRGIADDEAVHHVVGLLSKAISKRMVTPETYCFLSGGMDSSAVLSFTSELSDSPVVAITTAIEKEAYNEMDDAVAMAKHVGAVHHADACEPEHLFETLDTLVFHHDIPFSDSSAYPTYCGGKFAREHTDVIMTGEGPDESLAGNYRHVYAVEHNLFDERNRTKKALYRLMDRMVSPFIRDPAPSFLSKVRRKAHRESLSGVRIAYERMSFFPEIVKEYLCTPELWRHHVESDPYLYPESLFEEAGDVEGLRKYLHADIRFCGPDDLMIKLDRMCMAHGLETFAPFHDKELSRFLISLPADMKIRRGQDGQALTKYILRRACAGRFPPRLESKKKQGFSIPLGDWLRQDNGKYLCDLLLDDRTLSRGYFRPNAVRHMVDTFLSGREDYFFGSPGAMIALLTLELWHRRYID